MKLHYMGKYNGDQDSLPHLPHPNGSVPFKEPQTLKQLHIISYSAHFILLVLLFLIFIFRSGGKECNLWGFLSVFFTFVPHEFLHSICFKEDVYMYTNLKQGMLFVVGPEPMSKQRFIFLSLLPNIVFGFIPFSLFLINPNFLFLGTLGIFTIPIGVADYMNVFHALTQMPHGAKTYLHKFNSFWYLPEDKTT